MSAWLAIFMMFVAQVPGESHSPEQVPLSRQGYLGLSLRDLPSGQTIISWILPGPLHGVGIAAPNVDLARPDILVSVDGQAMQREQFRDYVREAEPGSTMVIEYHRAVQRGGGIPDEVQSEDEVQQLEVVVASREEWTGTIGRERGHDVTVEFSSPHFLNPEVADNIFGVAVQQHELTDPLSTLCGVFQKWQEKEKDFHSLSRVRAAFDNPFCLPELQPLITDPMREVALHPMETAIALVVENLDLSSPISDGEITEPEPPPG